MRVHVKAPFRIVRYQFNWEWRTLIGGHTLVPVPGTLEYLWRWWKYDSKGRPA